MNDGCPVCTPLGISCEEGYREHHLCPNYHGTPRGKVGQSTEGHLQDGYLVPWTGNSLGSRGLAFVSAHGSPRLIGIVGLPNAGKSTFLLMLYLLLARGRRLRTGSFAGSFTLGGWDHLAMRMRLISPDHPRFPPHTPLAQGRHPGMLHLRLRTPYRQLVDLLFTDASGEWFREWTVESQSPSAEGARWIAEHADAFLFLVDCASLAGEARAAAEAFPKTLRLAERLRDQARGRRVGIVWAKADHKPHPDLKGRLDRFLEECFPAHASFEVTIEAVRDDNDSRLNRYLEAADWAAAPRPVGIDLPDFTPSSEDLFFWIGSR